MVLGLSEARLPGEKREDRGRGVDLLMTAYDRPALSMSNLVGGKWDAAVRALYQPDVLSPSERKTLGDKYGQKSPVMKTIIDLATNPLVILGAALAFRYPLMSSKALFDVSKEAASLTKHLSWSARVFGTPPRIFGPDISGKMYKAVEAFNLLSEEMMGKVSKAFGTYERMTGKAPSAEVQNLIFFQQDGLHAAEGWLNKEVLGPASKHLGMGGFKGAALRIPEGSFSPKEMNAMSQTASALNQVGKEIRRMVPEEEVDEIVRILNEKGMDKRFLYSQFKAGAGKYEAGAEQKYYATHRFKGYHGMYKVGAFGNQEYIRAMAAESGMPISKTILKREGWSLPDMDVVEKMSKYFDPKALQIMRGLKVHYQKVFDERVTGVLQKAGGDTTKFQQEMAGMLKKFYGVEPEQAATVSGMLVEGRKIGGAAELGKRLEQLKIAVGRVPEYSTNLTEGWTRYVHDVAYMYSGSMTPKEGGMPYFKVMREELKRLKASPHAGDKLRANYMEDQYLPLLQGRKTVKQMGTQMKWDNFKLEWYERTQDPKFRDAIGKTKEGKRALEFLEKNLSDTEGAMSPGSLNAAITTWLYHGAMGFNPSPPMKNLLQPLITSMSLYGVKDTLKGAASLVPKLGRLYDEVLVGTGKMGLTLEEARRYAVKRVFPEFSQHVLSANPMLDALVDSTGGPFIKGAKSLLAKAKSASMFMFDSTELWNRLLTFESGWHHAARDPHVVEMLKRGLEVEARAEIGRLSAEGVRMTMFPGGVMGIPHAMLDVPPVFRQFTQFPMRMLDFLSGSVGFGGKFDLGTIGRTMRNSAIAYEVGKNVLGTDLSGGLLLGALPSPREGAPFYPFPLVSPALSLAGSAGAGVFTGDFEGLKKQLPILVPGGLAAKRAYQSLWPSRADYSKYKETGMIPVYDKDGKLMDNYSPMDLFFRSVGVQRTNMETRRQLGDYMLKQREVLTDFRRQYLQALIKNDGVAAGKVQEAFRSKYPELGPLRVKKSDISAIQKRRDLNRLQRILKTLPKEYQEPYAQMVGAVMSQEAGKAMDQGGEAIYILGDAIGSNNRAGF